MITIGISQFGTITQILMIPIGITQIGNLPIGISQIGTIHDGIKQINMLQLQQKIH